MSRRTKTGAEILYEQEFEWSITHKGPDYTSVCRITAPTLPRAIDLFDRRVKNHGRIVGARKIGPAMASEQPTIKAEPSTFGEVLQAWPIVAKST